MKRASSSDNPSQKKSVKISNEVDVKTIPNNNAQFSKVKKKTEKKSKFEKPIGAKKHDKSNILKASKPVTKSPSKLELVKSQKLVKNQKIVDKLNKKTSKSTTESGEKPNWTEFKKLKKELKEKRKEQKFTNLYKISVEAKKIGEKLRLSNCNDEERKQLCEKLHEILKGHYNQIIFTHDLSRVIQWLIKYCNTEIRESALLELKESWMTMFQTKYASKCLKSAIKYGSNKIKSELVNSCYGSVIKLLNHSISSPLFERMYSTCTDTNQKNNLKQEFYGDIYKSAKMNEIQSIKDVYKSAEDMKAATLSAVKANLTKILNKELLGSSLVHTVLYEFLLECSPADRTEMIVALRHIIVQLSESKDGSRAGVLCIWHGTSKDRKIIMKSLKEHLKDVFMSEHGHVMLMALIDCVDDTVLIKKILLSEMENDLNEIVASEYGKKVLLYLVARRDTHYFHPVDIEYFKGGDDNATSKKQADIREKELLDAVIDGFLEKIIAETAVWLANGSMQMITLAILKSNHSRSLKPVFEAITEFIIDEKSKIIESEKEYNAIEHSGLHMMLKKLLQMDKHFREQNKSSFAEVLVKRLDENIVNRWIEFNKGCFLLVFIIENANESVIEALSCIITSVHTNLECKQSPGAKILLKKVK